MSRPKFLLVEPSNTDEQIDEMLRRANAFCLAENSAYFLVVPGYDDDSRELYEIPEVLDLFDRLAKRGCMTVLEVNAAKDDDMRMIGAYQLWAIAKRLVSDRTIPLSRELLEQFVADLKVSNAIIGAL